MYSVNNIMIFEDLEISDIDGLILGHHNRHLAKLMIAILLKRAFDKLIPDKVCNGVISFKVCPSSES